MKKVLYLFDALKRGGAETSTLEISSLMRNWIPVVLSIYKGTELKKEFEEKGIKVYCLDVESQFSIRKIKKGIQNVINIERPDIIHSNLFMADQFARFLGPKNNIPVINSFVNDSYSPERIELLSPKEKFTLGVYKYIDKLFAPRVTKFMSLTNAIIPNNSKALEINPSNVTVISRGRNITEFRQRISGEIVDDIKKKYGPGPIILTVSRLLVRKGYMEAIKAMGNVIKVYPDAKYIIAGWGHDEKIITDLINSLDLNNNIFLLGNRTDIPSLLEAADIFLFPSHYEGQGGALVEAMLMGKKIIATRIPVLEESVKDNFSARLFNYRDIEDLSRQIIWSIENPVEMEEFARNAKIIAEKNFAIEKIARQHEELYDGVLHSNKKKIK